MGQITEWLQERQMYTHKSKGRRNNRVFCQEVVDQINKDSKRNAYITQRLISGYNMIAVFSERKK